MFFRNLIKLKSQVYYLSLFHLLNHKARLWFWNKFINDCFYSSLYCWWFNVKIYWLEWKWAPVFQIFFLFIIIIISFLWSTCISSLLLYKTCVLCCVCIVNWPNWKYSKDFIEFRCGIIRTWGLNLFQIFKSP